MEGEGLVLALVAIREACCHCCRVLVVPLSLRGLVIVSSFRVLTVVALWWRVFVVACCWRVIVVCPRFVVALSFSCVLSSSAHSFRGLMARSLGGVSEVCWDKYGMDSPNQTTYDDQCRRLSLG